MEFTQYVFPNGRRRPEVIDRPPDIEAKAKELQAAGWEFEIECNPDSQLVHMDCCDDERQLANRFCRNGPDVPVKVDELVNEAHLTWLVRGKPKAA